MRSIVVAILALPLMAAQCAIDSPQAQGALLSAKFRAQRAGVLPLGGRRRA